ncbi:MAG: beta-galactosidase, partial [Verrucomicrobiae bacterium]|nr:beta-galactosidase [Verrucomicrobiae bacterium]
MSDSFHIPTSFRRTTAFIASMFLALGAAVSSEPVQTADLSGTWDFDPNDGPATSIEVPGGGWYKQGFTNTNEADYERTISVPDIGQPQVTKLKFGAVNYQADLYIDEVFVGSSTQSHTAATFDITDHVTPGNSHAVRLHVKGHGALLNEFFQSLVPNGARSWANFLPQGIFRSAELLVYPQVHIEDVFVKTSVENTSLSYDVWLRNDSASAANVTLAGNLTSWNGDAWSYPSLPSQAVSIAAGSVTKVTIGPVNWNLGTASYWWPNVPYQAGYTAKLHDLDVTITGDGTHSTSVRFGFRECRQVSPDANHTIYTLNGVRVNFRGDSLQGANYDRINNGGLGDAFSTLPGFLPPSPGNPGWPKAVDNYQRLNYNVVRIH